MSTLPFDWTPDPPATPEPAATSGTDPISVTELSTRIVAALETLPSSLRVTGELSNLKRSRNGHWYFSLKDDAALIDCAMWSSRARGVKTPPAEGDAVEVTGHVEHYAKQGRTQLIVERLALAGQGTLQARFEALSRELRDAGWFDPSVKQELPILPRRICVLTAAGSAALADVRKTTGDRCPSVELLLVDVPVQGHGAAERIARTLRRVDAAAAAERIDAILVTRGGGSMEDLWAFNERVVAEAIFQCQTPVVAAIGHESDTTIAELVADHRASTPTQAVIALMPDAAELVHHLQERSHRLELLLRRRFEQARLQVDTQATQLHSSMQLLVSRRKLALEDRLRRLVERRPSTLLATRRRGLDSSRQRLHDAASARCQQRRQQLDATHRRLRDRLSARLQQARVELESHGATLEAVAPQSVLDRGFSLTRAADGTVIRSAEAIAPGTSIVTTLASGRLESTVDVAESGEPDGSGTVDSS